MQQYLDTNRIHVIVIVSPTTSKSDCDTSITKIDL